MDKLCKGCFKFYDDEFELCSHCGYFEGSEPKEPNHLFVGTELAERYVIGNVLGFGGFGITYKAWDKKLDSVVAIKEYYPSGIVNRPPGTKNLLLFSGNRKKEFEHGLIRFIEEARNMTKFNAHKNIVNVYEYFEENNTAYIVMEFLDGCNLGEYIESNGNKLDIDTSVEIICHICNALKDIHGNGIIHRDISPDNIYLCNDGTVKLIDFGAARFSAAEEAKNFTIILKPGFAPPEQYEQISDQGPKTDVYALGATLYYCITGEKPDESTNRKVKDSLVSPSEVDHAIEPYLSDSVMKAMAIEPSLRFESVDDFEKAIKKEIKVKDPKKEKKSRKIKRLVGIFTLVVILSVAGTMFFANVDKKNEEVTLDPATINVYYIQNEVNSEALSSAYSTIVSEFCDEYPDVAVNMQGYSQADYEAALAQLADGDCDINLFISNSMTSQQLDGMLDLSSVIYPETDNKLYFLSYILSEKNPTGCYFLDNYDAEFPEHKQMPSGFNVPVLYVNTTLVPFEYDSVDGIDDIQQYIGEETNLIVNSELKNEFSDLFGANFSENITEGTKDQFMAGQAAFYFSDTSEFFEIRKMPSMQTGIPKVVSIDINDLPCAYSTFWSIAPSEDEAENAAAIRFLTFLLSGNAQSRLFGKSDVETALPINEDALSTFISIYSELEFIVNNIKNYIFR